MLSVGAAYGVVVAIFQWGWGSSLIGVHETVPIMPLAPMLMFAILFGLSMDYEVFLLSRVREHYLRHRDPKAAIVEGVGSTGRVITSAALIMISVFGAFILMSDVITKMFGVGLSLAVLLDVTLVRMVLVPAVMSLLGHRAWWLPGWLDRLLPTIDLEGGADDARTPTPDVEDRPQSGPRLGPSDSACFIHLNAQEVHHAHHCPRRTEGRGHIGRRCRSSCWRWPPSCRPWHPSTSPSRRSRGTPTPRRPSCRGSSTPTRWCSPHCCSWVARSATATAGVAP